MPEMGPLEDEQEDNTLTAAEEASTHARNEQSARSFFAVLSFCMAFIFLISFINNPPGSISGVLVLLGIFAFGLGGIYLLAAGSGIKRSTSTAAEWAGSQGSENGSHAASRVEGSFTSIEAAPPPAEEPVGDDEEAGPFETLVAEALASIPAAFQVQMANLALLIESEADEEVLARVGTRPGYTLLGLYEGVPLSTYGHAQALLPERITIYQRAIEAYCHGDPERIREQVRSTVLHEVAHHFGIDHAEMPIWIR
jgi:predicted Zn-dependent protease with MMP-like domain